MEITVDMNQLFKKDPRNASVQVNSVKLGAQTDSAHKA